MKIVRIISALLFAILVLVSSTNFMVGLHICMGKVQHVALFSKASGCEMEKTMPACHRHAKAPCCEDETILHAAEDFNNTITQIHFHVPLTLAIAQPPVFIFNIIPTTPLTHSTYHTYHPPPLCHDLTVAHHVFLI